MFFRLSGASILMSESIFDLIVLGGAVGVEQALLNMTIAEKRAILRARTECPARANNDNKKAGAATAA